MIDEELLKEFIRDVTEHINSGVPDRNCSCHIAPPCSDCTSHAWARDLVERGKSLLKEFGA